MLKKILHIKTISEAELTRFCNSLNVLYKWGNIQRWFVRGQRYPHSVTIRFGVNLRNILQKGKLNKKI